MRAAFALVMLGVLGTIIQRQFAQRKKDANNGSRTMLIEKNQPIPPSPVIGTTRESIEPTFPDEWEARQPRSFISAELEFERGLVKGQPFFAELTVETVWPLQNGGSTTHRSVSLIYRDGEGRTRRDLMPSQAVTENAVGLKPQISIINDPVAAFSYVLDHRASLARRMTSLSIRETASDEESVKIKASEVTNSRFRILSPRRAAENNQKPREGVAAHPAGTKKEFLGQREIDGILAEGERLTQTIPVGIFGSQDSIKIVSEQWYSPNLRTVLQIKRFDPRFGESIYNLTNINRSEPTAALFTVPTGYKIRDESTKD